MLKRTDYDERQHAVYPAGRALPPETARLRRSGPRGFADLDRAAAAEDTPRPITMDSDLLVVG